MGPNLSSCVENYLLNSCWQDMNETRNAKISELLGHRDEKTTKIYLDDFENEELYEATLNLL